MTITQATMWTAQSFEAVESSGGTGAPTDILASELPIEQVMVFEIVHNTYSHGYFALERMWYKDDVQWQDYTYPSVYQLKDGSLLTVDVDEASGQLLLTQTEMEVTNA